MALTEKQRRQKLLEVRTGEEFHDLYVEVFGEEFPETVTRNPNDDIDMNVQKIDTNIPPIITKNIASSSGSAWF